MSKLRVYIPILSILLLSATSLSAQEPYFYDGTRSLSMGKAFVGLADDENAIFYNPACLSRIEGHKVSLSGYIQQYSWEVTVWPLAGWKPNYTDRGFTASYVQKRFGISFSYTGKGWWEDVTISDWMSGTSYTKKPMDYEKYVAASYAHDILPWFSLGLTGKYLHFSPSAETDLLENSDGVTFDLGFLFDPVDRLSIGINLVNLLSSDINYAVYNDYTGINWLNELPINVTFGLAWLPIEALSLSADVRNLLQDDVSPAVGDYILEFKRSYHLGLEWRPTAGVSLRAGYYLADKAVDRINPVLPFGSPSGTDYYEYEKYNNFAFGAGFLYRRVTFDIGVKIDDRSSKMEESETSELQDNTAMGSASLSYTF